MSDEIKVEGGSSAPVQSDTGLLTGDSDMDRLISLSDGVSSGGFGSDLLMQNALREGGDSDGVRKEGEEAGQKAGQEVAEGVATEAGAQESPEKAGDGASPRHAPEAKPSGTLRFKTPKGEIEVPEDAKIIIRVNQADEEVSVADLRRDYQGRVPWERHFRELKEDRRKFDSDVKAIDGKIRKIVEMAQADPFKAIEEIVLMAGKDPADFLPLFIKQAEATVEDIKGKSEEEVNAAIEKRRVEFKQRKVDEEAKRVAAEKEELEMGKYLATRQKELGITDDELQKAWDIAKQDPKLLAGKKGQEIADLLCNYVIHAERPFSMIEGVIDRMAPELRAKEGFITSVKNMLSPPYSESDIVEIIEGFVGKKTEPKKVQSSPSKDSTRERPTQGPTSQKIPQRNGKQRAEGGLEDFDPIGLDGLNELTKFF